MSFSKNDRPTLLMQKTTKSGTVPTTTVATLSMLSRSTESLVGNPPIPLKPVSARLCNGISITKTGSKISPAGISRSLRGQELIIDISARVKSQFCVLSHFSFEFEASQRVVFL